MYFSFKMMLREIKRNKSKVCIAFVVSLILFMSAFTLCNVASALPYNFYNYYEDYFPDTIGIKIHNADEKLYNNKDTYFIDTTVNWNEVYNGVKLENLARDKSVTSSVVEDDGETITIQTLKASVIDLDFDDMFAEDMKNVLIDGGEIWTTDENVNGIWISDYVSNILDVSTGDSVMFTVEDDSTLLKVNGVISNKLYGELIDDGPVFAFMHSPQARKIMFDFDMSFYMYGNVLKVNDIFSVYNALDGDYSLSDSVAMDMVSKVKNAEIICGIIGGIMLIGGIVILLNFISMFISSNIKHIGVMRMLGAKTKYITLAYYMIFMLLVTAVSLVSWSLLPLYNFILSAYCASIGYPFTLGINYGLVFGLFAVVYILVTLVMLIKGYMMNRLSPNQVIMEDD